MGISVWDHKTASSHGAARLAVHVKVYQLLKRYMGSKEGPDLVFTTTTGEKVTHVGLDLYSPGRIFWEEILYYANNEPQANGHHSEPDGIRER